MTEKDWRESMNLVLENEELKGQIERLNRQVTVLEGLLKRATSALEKLERCFIVEDAELDWDLIEELRKPIE